MEMGPGSGHLLAVCPSPLSCGLHLQGIKDELEYQVAGRTTAQEAGTGSGAPGPTAGQQVWGKKGTLLPPHQQLRSASAPLSSISLVSWSTILSGWKRTTIRKRTTEPWGEALTTDLPGHTTLLPPELRTHFSKAAQSLQPKKGPKLRIRRQEEGGPREKPGPAGTPGRTEPELFTSVPR